MESIGSLRSSITSYEDQLSKIRALISSSNDAGKIEELKMIEQDLLEILTLTQEQLLQLRKNEILSGLNDESEGITPAQPTNDEDFDGDDESVDDLLDTLIGIQCRVPYKVPHLSDRSMGISLHSAVVSEVVLDDFIASHQITDLKVQIFFCHPLVQAMKPCPYFLDDSCTFGDDKCRFSHGCLVRFSDLLEYMEPNFDEIAENSHVLVRNSEALWTHGTIIAVCREEKRAVVKIMNTCQESAVSFDELFPLGTVACNEAESTDQNDISSDDHDDLAPMEPSSSNYTLTTPFHAKPESALGNWETHTKGFGSRLMAKMGYVIGDGLGKSNQGIVNPVKSVVLPKGKSLDTCLEQLKKEGKDPLHSIRKEKRLEKLKNQKHATGYKTQAKRDVFDFLNNQLRSHPDNVSAEKNNSNYRNCGNKSIQTARAINVELLKIDGNKRTIASEIKSLNKAILRNRGKDSVVLKQLEGKVAVAEEKLVALNKSEIKLNREKQSRDDRKKLSIF